MGREELFRGMGRDFGVTPKATPMDHGELEAFLQSHIEAATRHRYTFKAGDKVVRANDKVRYPTEGEFAIVVEVFDPKPTRVEVGAPLRYYDMHICVRDAIGDAEVYEVESRNYKLAE